MQIRVNSFRANHPRKESFRFRFPGLVDRMAHYFPLGRLWNELAAIVFLLFLYGKQLSSLIPNPTALNSSNRVSLIFPGSRSQEEEEHRRFARYSFVDRWNPGTIGLGSVGSSSRQGSDRQQARPGIGLYHRLEEVGVGRWGPRARSRSSGRRSRIQRMGEI